MKREMLPSDRPDAELAKVALANLGIEIPIQQIEVELGSFVPDFLIDKGFEFGGVATGEMPLRCHFTNYQL